MLNRRRLKRRLETYQPQGRLVVVMIIRVVVPIIAEAVTATSVDCLRSQIRLNWVWRQLVAFKRVMPIFSHI